MGPEFLNVFKNILSKLDIIPVVVINLA
jgi:hypothetical protein